MSVLGKTLEKLLIGRVQRLVFPLAHPAQYGFMPQRSTEDTLYNLVSHVKDEREKGLTVIVVSLDIEGAFDNAW